MTPERIQLSKYLILLAKAAIAALAFYFIFSRVDYRDALDALGGADIFLICLAVLVMYGRHLASALRMRTLLGFRGHETTLTGLFWLDYIGMFFTLFLPTSVGGDLVRAFYFHRDGISKRVLISSILIERSMGVLALAALGVVGLGYYYLSGDYAVNMRMLAICGVICVGVIVVISALYFGAAHISRIFGNESRRSKPLFIFLDEVSAFSGSPRVWVHTFVTSAAFQFFAVLVTYLIARSLGDQTPIVYFMFISPVVWILSMLPLSPAGLGIREGAFIYLFSLAGMPADTAAAVAMLFLFIFLSQAIVGGLLYMGGGSRVTGVPDVLSADDID